MISTPALGPGQVGNSYTADFYAINGTTPYTFAVTSGALPDGFTMTPAGHMSGTAVRAASFNFTITATDATTAQATQNYTLVVTGGGLSLASPTTLPTAQINAVYTNALMINGGTAPYNVSVTGSGLPPGLAMSAAGVLSGTPTVAGTYSFPVSITDSATPQAGTSATLTLTVSAPSTAMVNVDTTKVLATVPASAYGIFTGVYDPKLSDTGALPALLKLTGTNMMRYPGGGYADSFHWAQHAISPIYASSAPACGQVQNGFLAAHTDFGSFVRTLQATGSQAVITVNYGSSVADSTGTVRYGTDGQKTCSEPNTFGQPQEAAAWVAYANGSPASTQVIGVDNVGFDWKTVGFWATLRASQPLASDDGYNFLRLGLAAPIGSATGKSATKCTTTAGTRTAISTTICTRPLSIRMATTRADTCPAPVCRSFRPQPMERTRWLT